MTGSIALGASFIIFGLSLFLLITYSAHTPISFNFNWFSLSNAATFTTGVNLNNTALLMLVLVTGISFLVQMFSFEYMKDDDGFTRYYSFLSFFTFSMIGVVVASNLLLLFIFWELVGFASYLLIGFWYKKESATNASKKAFIVNRIGDAGFLLGILIVYSSFKSLDLQHLHDLINRSTDISSTLLFFAGLGLFMGCVGKSAQFPLQIWLPDAMEGPTPVSALIHAATMVAAGIFLLSRVYFLLDLDVLVVIAFTGALTAFMGAVAALRQNDIKKVLAFSTISQLGYMVMAMGMGAYNASIFHLVTHAFFKAGLFLCAGSIIHYLHTHYHHTHADLQDMRNMGGLRRKLPITFVAYCITAAALIGLPFTSGFLSKDAIISYSISWSLAMSDQLGFISYLIPILALVTVLLTAYYMARQYIMVFTGNFRLTIRAEIKEVFQVKESLAIATPLIVLALFSIFIFFSIHPLDADSSWILALIDKDQTTSKNVLFLEKNSLVNQITQYSGGVHLITLIATLVLGIAGILIAYKQLYQKNGEDNIDVLSKISLNNWYLDAFYQKAFVRPTLRLSNNLNRVDRRIIDQFLHFLAYATVIFAYIIKVIDKLFVDGIVNSSVYITGRVGILARSFQGGKVQYFFIIAILSLIAIVYFTAF